MKYGGRYDELPDAIHYRHVSAVHGGCDGRYFGTHIREVGMTYYLYNQNNSGGSFDIDDKKGIGPRVWIEASNRAEAHERATSLGIYFDGVEKGIDCSCCGDRWPEPWDIEDLPRHNTEYDFYWHPKVYVHPKGRPFYSVTLEDIQKVTQ